MLVCCFGHPYSTLTPTLIFSVPQNWRRRLPAGWEEAMLPHLLSWLVGQCGRAADRTSMPVSTARGADAASAGRRRRRQSPGACAVRGPPKPQCAVVGSRLADTLLALPDGDSWALRFGALPISRAGPGAAGAAQCRGSPNSSWVTRMGDFFLLHRCCECWPLSGSD